MTHPVDQFLLATVRDSGGAIGRLKVIRGEVLVHALEEKQI